jgi:hypothetical protein
MPTRTKLSCARCHHSKKSCTFNGPPVRGVRKRKNKGAEEEGGEGDSQTSRTTATRSDDDVEEGSSRKRARRSGEGEEARLKKRVTKAAAGLAMAEIEWSMAKFAMNEYATRKRTGGSE